MPDLGMDARLARLDFRLYLPRGRRHKEEEHDNKLFGPHIEHEATIFHTYSLLGPVGRKRLSFKRSAAPLMELCSAQYAIGASAPPVALLFQGCRAR